MSGHERGSGRVLVLTGPPGSGKTTTAGALAASSPTPAVHLHADDFWRSIKSGAIPPFLPAAHGQNAVVMDALAKAAEVYAAGGFFVAVDGIVGPWFLDPFRRTTVELHYVVLRPTLDATLSRALARGGDALTDPGPIGELHRQFGSLGPLERHVIDTTHQRPDETLAAVREAVRSGAFRLEAGARPH
jgi:chloramphenicol 3-O-phosphotransferase